MEKSFPSVDKRILQFVLYNFAYQLPEATSYLRKIKPGCYVETAKPPEPTPAPQPAITVLPAAKKPAYKPPHNKKAEKHQHEAVAVPRQDEPNSGLAFR